MIDLQVTLPLPIKIDFQEGDYGRHISFPIGTNLAIFDLQITKILPTKFRVNWPFVQKKKCKINILRLPSSISVRNDFSYFGLQVILMRSAMNQLAFRFRRRSANSILKIAAIAAILDF